MKPSKPSREPAVNNSLRFVRPFVVIDPYQYEGDVAFGVWSDKHNRYLLGDGDAYNADELKKYWPDAVMLTWSQLETRLKNTKPKWVCSNCGNTEYKEREIICWKCGKGDMVYQRPNDKVQP